MYSAFPLRSAGALRLPVRPVAFVTSSSFVLLSGTYFRNFLPLATYTVSAAERTDQTSSPLITSFLASFSSLTTAADFVKASQAFLHEFQPLRIYAQSIFMLFLHRLYSVALLEQKVLQPPDTRLSRRCTGDGAATFFSSFSLLTTASRF